jgi:hypothetical protein
MTEVNFTNILEATFRAKGVNFTNEHQLQEIFQ